VLSTVSKKLAKTVVGKELNSAVFVDFTLSVRMLLLTFTLYLLFVLYTADWTSAFNPL